MRSRALLVGLVLTTLVSADPELLPTSSKRWYDLVKPTQRELKWRKIPWLTDLSEAVKTAKEEKRPLVIWTAGDEPLDRC